VCFNGACAMLLRPDEEQKGQRQQASLSGRSRSRSRSRSRDRVDPGQPRVLFSERLTADAATEVLALCRRMDWCASYCLPLGAAVAPANAKQEQLVNRFEDLEGVKQDRVPDLSRLLLAGDLPLKVVAVVDDPEVCAQQARAALPEGLVHIIAAEVHIEFLSPTVNKGATLQRVCKEVLNIPLADVVAFGDNHNDKEMLGAVGEGVAMRNAKDCVKTAAHRVCQWSNDEEGVARDLEAMVGAGHLRSCQAP